MKKVVLVILALFFLTGCSSIADMKEMDIISKNIALNTDMYNQYRTGYKYYLPRGLTIVNKDDFNEIARSGQYNYYIYIDVVSYYNKVKETYDVDNKAYLSEAFFDEEKFGYLEINQGNDKYLIEIMYNYAKIEVIVKKDDINVAVTNAISILSSIKYNDQILDNLMGDNILKFKEIEFNIFDPIKDVESTYLTTIDQSVYDKQEVRDTDLIE